MNQSINTIYANKWWVLLGLGLACTILNLDITIVNLALPVIGKIFSISLTNLQWINNSFMLGATCITLLAANLSDQYGRRRIFLWGMATFTVGSLLASVATNAWMIVIGRAIQGMGIGSAFPMTIILLNESFPEYQRGMGMGLLSTFTGVSQAIGPTIGGFIVQWLGWRWAFLINIPICPWVIWIIWRKCLVGLQGNEHPAKLHYQSAVLLIISLIAIILALNQCHAWGYSSPAFLISLSFGILLMAFVLYRQTQLANPIIDLSLFRIHAFAAINVIRPIFQFVFFGFYFILPLYLQNFLGYSPVQSGAIILMMSAVTGTLSPLVGRCIDSIGVRKLIVVAQASMIAGFGLFMFTPLHTNFWIIGIGLLCIGICSGIMFSASNYTAVNSLPGEKKGIGMGIFMTTGGLASSMGIALSGAVLSSVSSWRFTALNPSLSINDITQHDTLFNIISGAQPLSQLDQVANSAALLPTIQHSFLHGFHWVMIMYTALALLGLYYCRYLTLPPSHAKLAQPLSETVLE